MANYNIAALVAAAGVLAGLACGGKTEEERREEVATCSRVNSQAELIALCLVTDHDWDDTSAQRAGTMRAQELDSTRAWQEDSAWHTDSTQHRADVRACSGGDRMRECLRLRGWPDARALRTADSLWQKDAARHLLQIRTCLNRRREGPLAACLVLHYKWSNERALTTEDSIRRARVAR